MNECVYIHSTWLTQYNNPLLPSCLPFPISDTFGYQLSLQMASSHSRAPMGLCIYVSCSVQNLVVSVYGLSDFRKAHARLETDPKLAGATLLGMLAAKNGIAGEAGGMYTGIEVQLRCIVSGVYSEIFSGYGLL